MRWMSSHRSTRFSFACAVMLFAAGAALDMTPGRSASVITTVAVIGGSCLAGIGITSLARAWRPPESRVQSIAGFTLGVVIGLLALIVLGGGIFFARDATSLARELAVIAR